MPGDPRDAEESVAALLHILSGKPGSRRSPALHYLAEAQQTGYLPVVRGGCVPWVLLFCVARRSIK